MNSKQYFEQLYSKKNNLEKIPWHINKIPGMLIEIVKSRPPSASLDIGCGLAFCSIYLAQKGWKTTGIDLSNEAIRMAKEEATRSGVKINLIQADILKWRTQEKFDLIIDRGCLHSLADSDLNLYRRRILGWLAPNGNYLLAHFGKSWFFDWSPLGPKRRSKKKITNLFMPELTLQDYAECHHSSQSYIVRKGIKITYWFARKSEEKPFPLA